MSDNVGETWIHNGKNDGTSPFLMVFEWDFIVI
jgi:hypothetical protein